jgi:hypothetical protein
MKAGLDVPLWYAGTLGVPNWLLRQKCRSKKMDDKRRALALLVRMNYILDFFPRFTSEDQRHVLQEHMERRPLRRLFKAGLHIYDGSQYQAIMHGTRMNTSFALSEMYNWQRALACTVGNFVHLLALLGLEPR